MRYVTFGENKLEIIIQLKSSKITFNTFLVKYTIITNKLDFLQNYSNFLTSIVANLPSSRLIAWVHHHMCRHSLWLDDDDDPAVEIFQKKRACEAVDQERIEPSRRSRHAVPCWGPVVTCLVAFERWAFIWEGAEGMRELAFKFGMQFQKVLDLDGTEKVNLLNQTRICSTWINISPF